MAFKRRRSRSESGAVAVEFALIAPMILILMFGILELSFLMKDHVSMSSTVRGGARAASAAADAGPGTCMSSGPTPPPCTPAQAPALAQAAADNMQRSGKAIPTKDIDWVIIYRAGTNGFPIGQNSLVCGTDCVKYNWDSGLSRFVFQSGSWKSSTVNACLNDVGRHSVGVGMQATHSWLSPIGDSVFGSIQTMQEHTVMQFEPLEADRCKPGTANAHG